MKKKASYILAVIVLVLVLLFVQSVTRFIRFFNDRANVQVFDKNSYLNADSLNVYSLESKTDSVIFFKGVQILNFWAGWCKPCIEEMPDLYKLQEKYPNLKVLLLSFDDTSSLYKAMRGNSITLPAYLVKDTLVFEKPEILPRTVVLRDNKVIRDMYVSRDWSLKEYTTLFDSLSNIIQD